MNFVCFVVLVCSLVGTKEECRKGVTECGTMSEKQEAAATAKCLVDEDCVQTRPGIFVLRDRREVRKEQGKK